MLKKILACGSVVTFTLVNLLIAAEIFINTVTVASGAAENTGAAKSPSIVINTS